MAEQPKLIPTRPWRASPVSLTLLLLGWILAIVIFTQPISPHDYPYGFYPPFAGAIGEGIDWLRTRLFDSFGLGIYTFTLGWLLVCLSLVISPRWMVAITRAIGWGLLCVCTMLLADWYATAHLTAPLAGAGGDLGAFLGYALTDRFQPAGVWLLFSCALGVGIILTLDHGIMALFRLIQATGRFLRLSILRWFQKPADVPEPTPPPPAKPELKRVHKTTEKPPEPAVVPVKGLSPELFPIVGQAKEPALPEVASPMLPTLPDVPITELAPKRTASLTTIRRSYDLPPLDLLEEPPVNNNQPEDEKHLREVAALLEKTFADFGINIKVVGINTGPVVTQYEIALETGLRVSRVTGLADDLALNLKVPSVRIVAPLPNRNTVGIEVPNKYRSVVRIRELIQAAHEKVAKYKLPLFLGKDSEGNPLVYDLADMPHLLIASRTGTGKSVCLNSIILSLLLTRTPAEARMVMIDPKQVELAEFGKLPHLLHPVVVENDKAEAILNWAVDKMEERYNLMRLSRVRNIHSYNDLPYDEILRRVGEEYATKFAVPEKMPYVVMIIDEVGDLMMANRKEVESQIIRLAQKSRAAGIHLILTTQRPTVDVITGLIKSNLPARICFQVADRSNSRVVLDEMGAEKLLGKGDMLFLQPNTSTLVRAQGTYASDSEISAVVSYLEVEEPEYDDELLNLEVKNSENSEESSPPPEFGTKGKKKDKLYNEAVEIVIREGRGSCSLLQRALGIGYGRAARLIDLMAEDGIVGEYNGAQPRQVLLTLEQWHSQQGGGTTSEVTSPPHEDDSISSG